MISGRKMLNEKNVFCPGELRRVLRTAHYKALLRASPRRFDQQHVEGLLPILRIRAEVRQRCRIPFVWGDPAMHLRIYAPIKRGNFLRGQLGLSRFANPSYCETQDSIELTRTARMNGRH